MPLSQLKINLAKHNQVMTAPSHDESRMPDGIGPISLGPVANILFNGANNPGRLDHRQYSPAMPVPRGAYYAAVEWTAYITS
jgi:hypothetical protein